MRFWKPLAIMVIATLCLVGTLTAHQAAYAQDTPSVPVTVGMHPQQVTPLMTQKLAALKAAGQLAPALPSVTPSYQRRSDWPLLLIHGFKFAQGKGSGAGFNCYDYFDPNAHGVQTYLRETHSVYGVNTRWSGPITTLGYYNGDVNCGAYLQGYASYCTGYWAGSNGTNNENLAHIACELAWYIWFHYSQSGNNVQVVAHSMGGLILRQALYATPIAVQLPPYLLVQDAVTLDTPHGGVLPGFSLFGCGGCLQATQMHNNDNFMKQLFVSGQNPQGGSTGTDWTMMGQQCLLDPVFYQWATYMSGGHKVAFSSPCFGHGGFMTDWGSGNGDTFDATEIFCDFCATAPNNWINSTDSPHSLHNMLLSLIYPTW